MADGDVIGGEACRAVSHVSPSVSCPGDLETNFSLSVPGVLSLPS